MGIFKLLLPAYWFQSDLENVQVQSVGRRNGKSDLEYLCVWAFVVVFSSKFIG